MVTWGPCLFPFQGEPLHTRLPAALLQGEPGSAVMVSGQGSGSPLCAQSLLCHAPVLGPCANHFLSASSVKTASVSMACSSRRWPKLRHWQLQSGRALGPDLYNQDTEGLPRASSMVTQHPLPSSSHFLDWRRKTEQKWERRGFRHSSPPLSSPPHFISSNP